MRDYTGYRAISDSSYAGLTRVSIFEKHRHFRKMDCRVKPGNDGSYGSKPVKLGFAPFDSPPGLRPSIKVRRAVSPGWL
jgi:hypothetical protein